MFVGRGAEDTVTSEIGVIAIFSSLSLMISLWTGLLVVSLQMNRTWVYVEAKCRVFDLFWAYGMTWCARGDSTRNHQIIFTFENSEFP